MKCIFPFLLFFTGCATSPKCGNPSGANTLYAEAKTCEVRIRQVVIGSKMRIPESLKGPGLASHELSWADSSLVDGKIQLGHFVLIPKTSGGTNEH